MRTIIKSARPRKTMRSKRFYKYFLSYIIIIVTILVVIGTVVQKNFIQALKDETESMSIASLRTVCNGMDTRLKELDRLALSISSNYTIRYSSIMGDAYNNWQCVKELAKYKASNGFVEDIVLYLPNRDERIYSTLKSGDVDTLFNTMYAYEDWGKEGFIDLMELENTPVIRPIETIHIDRMGIGRYATYIYPLSSNTIKPQGLVMFLISDYILYGMTQNILKGYDGYVAIYDAKDNQILLNSFGLNSEKISNIRSNIDISSIDIGISYRDIDGQNYAISKLQSNYNGWSYITIMPTAQLFTKVDYLHKAFVRTLFIILIVGFGTAFVFSLSHYKVLGRLVDFIKGEEERLDIKGTIMKDEVTYIKEAIEKIAYTNKGLNEKLRINLDKARSQFLLSLLKGNVNIDDIGMEIFQNFGIDIYDRQSITVLVFAIDNYHKPKDGQGIKIDEDLLIFSIINVVEELAEEVGYGYGIDLMDQGSVALIISLRDGLQEEFELSKLSNSVQSFFHQYYHVSLSVGIGNVYRDPTKIKSAFIDASKAVSYRFIRGEGNIIFYHDVKENLERQYKYPNGFEKNLILAINQCNNIKIRKRIEEIKDYIYSQNISPEMVWYMYYGLINNIIKMANEYNIDLDESVDTNLDNIFTHCEETLEELMDTLEAFCINIAATLNRIRTDKDSIVVKAILEYIENNYDDPSLCLDLISDHMDMSVSYCTKAFKKYTNSSLMQYVDNYRMSRAKEMLIETDVTLKELVEMVGYIDETNFIRKFKRNEGLTPIQYRETNRMCKYVQSSDG